MGETSWDLKDEEFSSTREYLSCGKGTVRETKSKGLRVIEATVLESTLSLQVSHRETCSYVCCGRGDSIEDYVDRV